MTTLSPFPNPPSRNGSPDSFADDADVFLGHFPVFQQEVNIVSGEIETNKNTAITQAGVATTAAGTATTQAGIATTAAGTATTQAGIATTKASEVQIISEDFRVKYLGDKPVDPLLNNQGGTLVAGALYFNTVIDIMRVYNGASWQDASSSVNGTANRYNYVASAGQTTFSATYDIGYVDVYRNGIRLTNSQFTANDTTSVVLATPATLNDSIVIIGYGNFLFSKPIPNELGHSDKFFGTDGTNLSWKNTLISNTSQPTITLTQQGSGATLKLTNTGSGPVILIEDDTSDSSPTIIDSSGNVSIGNPTAGPEKLKVQGASNTTFASFGTAVNKINLKGTDSAVTRLELDSTNSTQFAIGTNSGVSLSLFTNNINRITIDSSGRVAIGKTPNTATFDFRYTTFPISTNTTLIAGCTYVLTATAAHNFPPTPVSGDWVTVINRSNTTSVVINGNGSNIFGVSDNIQINKLNFNETFVFIDSTRGWVYK